MISLGAGVHGGMIITPDFRKSGTDAVQLTYFTRDGQPSGHTTFKSLADALDENFLDVNHPVSMLKKNTDPAKVFSAYEDALFEPHNDEILNAPFHYLSPLRPVVGVVVEGFVSSDLSGRIGVLSRYDPLDLYTQIRLNLFPMSPEAIRAAAEEMAVILAPKLKSRYARKFVENPPIRHAWEMTYDELLGELESLNSVVDREGLDRLRPLLAEVYPEYVDVDYRDYTQDPWGIGRAIQAGTEIPRAPTVDLSQRLRKLKEQHGIEKRNPGGTKASCHCVHAPGDISDYEGIRAEYTVSNVGNKYINSFEDLVDYAREVLNVESDTRERFYAIYLNQRNRVLGHRLIGAGSMTEAMVHPSLVFGPAVALQSPTVAYIHNHPSEDGTPSDTDIELTKRLVNVGHQMLGIRTLDHVVIGKQKSVSLYENFQEIFTPSTENPPYPEHESELTWEPAVSANPRIDTSETYKLFEPEKAEAVTEELCENDPDWTYVVKHDPKGTGKSFIEVYDEDGEYIGRV